MDWSALASFGGTVGSAISGILSYGQAKKLQQRNFDFQERMSNTAHQREVDDLRKAGLNPILSATGGQGASTPSGGISSANMPDLGNSINEGLATAKQLSMMNSEKKALDAKSKLDDKTAETEEAKKRNFEQNTALQNAQLSAQLIENSYLPEYKKNELKEQLSRVELNFAGASAKQMDAITNRMNANTNKTNAQTNKENAITNRNKKSISGLGFNYSWSHKSKLFQK